MSAETTFNMISVGFSALGLLNAADGFRRTFKSVAAPGDSFFKRVLATEAAMVERWRFGLTRAVRRAFRRPAPTITATLGTALSAEAAMSVRSLVQFGPLPDVTQDPAAFTAEVERRLNRVFQLAQDVQHDLRQEEQVRDTGDQQVASHLGTQISALDEQTKRAVAQPHAMHEQQMLKVWRVSDAGWLPARLHSWQGRSRVTRDLSGKDVECISVSRRGLLMSDTSRARHDRTEPGPPPERGSDRFSDGPPDPLASLLAKVSKGEHISTPGDNAGAEDRDPHDEEWRDHDRHGPYAQGRRRKN